MTVGNALLIVIHALAAWVAVEFFVNLAHGLRRRSFILWHSTAVVAAFGGAFRFYTWVVTEPATPFAVTATAMTCVLVFEVVVFRYLYSGERWFLNWVDWIFPMFLATSTIYAVAFLW